MRKGLKKQVEEIFEKLNEEGFNISLIDYSAEEDGEVWVAYALNQDHFQVDAIKKELAVSGMLLEPADDVITPIDELYTDLKNICSKVNFEKALELLSQGKEMLSLVSQTIYTMDMNGNGRLFADGIEVTADYVTKEEMQGTWIEVNVVKTEEDYKNMSPESIKANLHAAYEKFQFDRNVRKI